MTVCGYIFSLCVNCKPRYTHFFYLSEVRRGIPPGIRHSALNSALINNLYLRLLCGHGPPNHCMRMAWGHTYLLRRGSQSGFCVCQTDMFCGFCFKPIIANIRLNLCNQANTQSTSHQIEKAIWSFCSNFGMSYNILIFVFRHKTVFSNGIELSFKTAVTLTPKLYVACVLFKSIIQRVTKLILSRNIKRKYLAWLKWQ